MEELDERPLPSELEDLRTNTHGAIRSLIEQLDLLRAEHNDLKKRVDWLEQKTQTIKF